MLTGLLYKYGHGEWKTANFIADQSWAHSYYNNINYQGATANCSYNVDAFL